MKSLFLDKHLYSPVVGTPAQSELILEIPESETWRRDNSFLRDHALSGPPDREELDGLFLREGNKVVEWKDLTFCPEFVPNTLHTGDYAHWFRGKVCALTELFHHSWGLRFMGAGRSYILKNVQVKGGGRTLPSQYFTHIQNSGLFHIHDALRSFMMSHLAHHSLPLGSPRGLAVLRHLDLPYSAFYIRECYFPRLAQLGPSLSEEVKERLALELTQFFGTADTEEWFRKIVSQLARMVRLGCRFQLSPDNVLVTGQCLDEEGWRWYQPSEGLCFYVEVKNGTVVSSTFSAYQKVFSSILKGYAHFMDDTKIPSYPQLMKLFQAELQRQNINELWNKYSAMDLADLLKLRHSVDECSLETKIYTFYAGGEWKESTAIEDFLKRVETFVSQDILIDSSAFSREALRLIQQHQRRVEEK